VLALATERQAICESVCTEREIFLHAPMYLARKLGFHLHHIHRISKRLYEERAFGFLIASRRLRATRQTNRPSRPRTDNLWGFPDQPRSPPTRHAQPHPCSARYAADAGCSTCFSGDAGLAAVELLIRDFRFELSLLPESLRVPKLKSFVPEAGRRHNKFNRNLRLTYEAGT
jgi:hypothetical protein